MTSHVVMVPPGTRKTELDAEFVRDRFSVLAFAFPLFWLAWYRLWIEAVVLLAASVAIALAAAKSGSPAISVFATAVSFLISVYVSLEGPGLRLAALRRRGWTDAGVFDAATVEDAAIRFYAESGGGPKIADVPAPVRHAMPPVPAVRKPSDTLALGMLGMPDGR